MGKVLAVTSGKGGVGKTSFCSFLGYALGARGKTVVIVELDTGLRGLDIMLGVQDRTVFDLSDILSERCSLSQGITMSDFSDKLFLIPASVSTQHIPTSEDIVCLCKTLRNRFDYILLDTPAGLFSAVHIIPQAADLAIVVATPDPVSVRDANFVARILRQNHFSEIRLVINRVSKKLMRKSSIRDLDEVIDGVGVPLLGVIPEDNALPIKASAGLPLDDASLAQTIFSNISKRVEGEMVPLAIQ